MRKIFILFLIFFFPLSVFADSGHSTIVMDVESGRVLYENNVNQKRLIASITKIMTCMVVLENMNVNRKITVGEEVLSMYGTNIYIEVGEEMSALDLLYGMMLRSGNDAAMTLATHTFDSLDEFILKMNEKAKEIGMKDTYFSNPTGLDDENENYSTAYDMALLSRYAYQNEIYRKIILTRKYSCQSSLKSYVWYNRVNLLSSYKKCIGGKNGYTPKAGKTLVSYAKNNDSVFTIVSLDDYDLYENHKELYEKFFSEYQRYTILDSKDFSIESSLVSNQKMFIKKSFSYPLKEEELSSLSTQVQVYSSPKNGKSGEVIIRLKDEKIGSVPIYSQTKKEEPSKGFFSWFQKLFV